ncbi:hypothetical protein [Microbacterium ulmi]|uniref:Integral membrane protein n=1 Tax=Microbacterium ulmi TaxID=179095 RepID=A0A7Y2M2G0_9MICO|nr:hypothetical protein [Microbacterium ulmi]NII71392.1 Na+/proline symporter [Microbacterium ulmi]NNH05255.1 hypothetical protein [Microbacterium ulmi]
MEILLALIFGAAIGAAAHYSVTGRDTRGAALLPLVGALSSSLVWMILTWAGLGPDNGLLWLSAVVVPAVVTFPLGVVLARVRRSHDARARARLKLS